MKDLREYLKEYVLECGEGAATPGNTMGMGNPIAPGEDVVGSGDIPTGTRLKKRKKKVKNREEHKYDKFHDSLINEPSLKESLFDDNFGIDIEKWVKEFKKKFRNEIGYGLTNPNNSLFTEQNLEMFKTWCESHQASTSAKDVCMIAIFPDMLKLEIYDPRSDGTMANYTWYKFQKVYYTCQIIRQDVNIYWDTLSKSRYSLCVKKSILYPIIRRT